MAKRNAFTSLQQEYSAANADLAVSVDIPIATPAGEERVAPTRESRAAEMRAREAQARQALTVDASEEVPSASQPADGQLSVPSRPGLTNASFVDRISKRAPRGSGKSHGLILTIPVSVEQDLIAYENWLYLEHDIEVIRSTLVMEAIARVLSSPKKYLGMAASGRSNDEGSRNLGTRVSDDAFGKVKRIAKTATPRSSVGALVALALIDIVVELKATMPQPS